MNSTATSTSLALYQVPTSAERVRADQEVEPVVRTQTRIHRSIVSIE